MLDFQIPAAWATDATLERDQGIVVSYDDGISFRIRRAGGANKRYAATVQAKVRPYERRLQTGELDEDLSQRLAAEAFAEAVVIDWQGVKDRQGQAVPFSPEAFVAFAQAVPELYLDLVRQAHDIANFRDRSLAEQAKN